MIAAPFKPAGSNRQMGFIAAKFALWPFGHAPDFGPGFIEGQIHRTVIFRVALSPAPGAGVIGRKDTADKGDKGQRMRPVIAPGVNIPPDITVLRDAAVKGWSAKRAAAASRPERAAIGTPGPGWVAPPAR